MHKLVSFGAFALALFASTWQLTASAADLKVLFLGDKGHHQPARLFAAIDSPLSAAGIELTYTEDVADLNLETLKQYSGLLVYANIDELPVAQEAALLEYVAGGGGFIPLHCASYCFRNSAAYVDLVGAQFQRHGGEIFATEILQPDHPIMQGFGGFESWDETYVHTKHNDRNRIVLEVRTTGEQAAGKTAEPWTWVRTHGSGRVFYTAWGHDRRTWEHPGFQNLLQRGIRWACGDDPTVVAPFADSKLFPIPKMTAPRTDVAEFEYLEVGPKIPNYLAGERWGVQGDVITEMQKPLPPEESIKHYVTPKNFRLELFVAEPEIDGKPIAMNWDERGRLWLCETIDYPNELMPPEQGRDRIRICEDTDGDGKADKFTVFAENISIPTSIEFAHGGVIVQAGVETLFLRDNDGDDRADERHVLITGWEMGDTHGGVSNFQYGLDNRYWAMQGYNNSRPKYAGGEHRGFRQGPFAFSLGSSDEQAAVVDDVEFIRSTTNNSWGLGISEEGLIFASTANRAPSFFIPIPNRYYERVRGWTPSLMAEAIAADHLFTPITDKVRQVDQHGGYTAGAGHALYTARTYPQAWWNSVAFVCGPTGHLVGTFVLQPEGSSFRNRHTFNLIASDDEWAAPIMAEVGPDGNVWIIDWYNYIIQHNPTPQGFQTGKGNAYESDLRDKTHGRIYRLVYEGEGGQPGAELAPKLDATQPATLVAGLKHPNRLWRRHAQRLLVERNEQDVVPGLLELLADQNVDSTGNNAGAIHALWVLHGIGALDAANTPAAAAVSKALKHPARGVRRNAALVGSAAGNAEAIVQADLGRDADPQVRLGALMALADSTTNATAGAYLASLAGDSSIMSDRHLREAMICAAASHANSFLTTLLTQQSSATTGEATGQAIRVIAEHIARVGMEDGAIEPLLAALSAGDSALASPVIEGLVAGWPRNQAPKLSDASEASLQSMVETLPAAARGPLVRLATLWGSERLGSYAKQISQSLKDVIEDNSAEERGRIAAARELVSLMGGDPATIVELIEFVTPQLAPALSSGLLRSLADASAENVAEELVKAWGGFTPSQREDVLAVLLARPATTNSLLEAISAGVITINDLSLDQRQSLRSHPNREIRRRSADLMSAAGAVVNADRQKVIEKYVAATHDTGDAAAGKLLFTKNCANCHKHSGEGQEIGPDLTGMAVHPKEELLIHILDPSRSVEGNFRRYTLLTAAGQVLSGMLAAESLSAVELIDAEGKRQSITRDDIEQLTSTNLSLMPEGFEQQLDLPQMTDLLEFLTSKGRFVPVPLAGIATAVSDRPLFSNDRNGPDQMIFDDWGPKVFEGVPFQLIDPNDGKRANMIMLNGPQGVVPPKMPREVTLPCNMPVKAIHMLGGVSGWGYPYADEKTASVIVRLNYQDGEVEEHELLNGVHFADYIRQVDVPESQFAFRLRGQQLRYLSVAPKQSKPIRTIDLVKGRDETAPMIMAVTLEQGDK